MGCGKMGTSLFDSRSDDRQGDDNTTFLNRHENEGDQLKILLWQ